ncbi:MAG: phosphomannomutase/phosphoglucomutase, partial [Alphaproteobacteria bacterium]
MSIHTFHPEILREYDIRGHFGKTLTEADAFEVGNRFAQKLAYRAHVCIARDGRFSSPLLLEALRQGLCQQGCRVTDIGIGPTPMLYFAVEHLNADAGVMVTGSHNPSDENGLKFALKDGLFYGDDIRAFNTTPTAAPVEHPGTTEECDLQGIYVQRLLKDYRHGKRPLNIVWDPGHGAAADVIAALLPQLQGNHTLINGVIDGSFPAHHPDPTIPENLEQLIAEVKGRGADLGIAFDGDGDRLGVVDSQGRILWGDQMMVFFAQDVLARYPGATIIADVKASQLLFDEIARLKGNPVMAPTGHSVIKAAMAETGALLAGEMSGHMFFADEYYGFDDAVYAALRFLRFLQDQDHSLDQLYDNLVHHFSTPEIRIPCEDHKKFALVERIKQQLHG